MIHSILVLFIGAPAPVPGPAALYQPWPACMMTVPDTDDGGMVLHCVPRQQYRRQQTLNTYNLQFSLGELQ